MGWGEGGDDSDETKLRVVRKGPNDLFGELTQGRGHTSSSKSWILVVRQIVCVGKFLGRVEETGE